MIDWFTVVAQLVNFLILIGLLKYFLYGRIMEAIEQRDAKINQQRHEAEKYLAGARQELERAKNRNLELDEQREVLLFEIRKEVDDFRKKQMKVVREEVENAQARWTTSIREEQDAFFRELKRRAADSVCTIARKALTDLADVSLESRMVARFLDEVRNMSADKRNELAETIVSSQPQTIIQTTHKLEQDLQQSLLNDLESILQTRIHARFEIQKDLLCGVAMQTNSHKLAWNLRDYLASLEDDIRAIFVEESVTHQHRPDDRVKA